MDTYNAMTDTMHALNHGVWEVEPNSSLPDLHLHHLEEMWQTVQKARTDGEPFSDGKLNRWLGWMQAVIVVCTNATLDEMKAINKKWADK